MAETKSLPENVNLEQYKKQAKDLAENHGDKIEDVVDKVADIANDKTGGKYSGQIETGTEKAKDFVEGLTDDDS